MADFVVSLDNKPGKIKPLHGVNNGPVGYGTLVDVAHRYKELAIPYARLHDPNWPHPREVDVPQIFPDFNADPDDPANYRFSQTDSYIRKIIDTGAKIIYRLGVSIEHTQTKYFTAPPADFDKWARICVGIVKHYTEGWADGFDAEVDCWEIWNEPDVGPLMWSGTFDQYLELYATASKAIKSYNPNLRVGGYAAAHPTGDNVPKFLDFCRKNNLPLDFFSWHTYSGYLSDLINFSNSVRNALDSYGFTDTESHLNEWNYFMSNWGSVFLPGNEYMRKDAFDRQKNEEGASFVAAAFICMQDLPVDRFCYYDGQPSALFCGLFDYYGVPQKTFYSFKAFSKMLDHSRRLKVDISNCENMYALAGISDDTDKISILISNYGNGIESHALDYSHLPDSFPNVYRIYAIDKYHDFNLIQEGKVSGDTNKIEFGMLKKSVVYIELG